MESCDTLPPEVQEFEGCGLRSLVLLGMVQAAAEAHGLTPFLVKPTLKDRQQMLHGVMAAAREAIHSASQGLGLNGAVVIEPNTGRVIGTSHGANATDTLPCAEAAGTCAEGEEMPRPHPLHHAVMRVIEAMAERDRRKFPPRGNGEDLGAEAGPSRWEMGARHRDDSELGSKGGMEAADTEASTDASGGAKRRRTGG
eukprot:gene31418-39508_t